MLNLRLLLVLCVCCLQIQAQSTPVKAHGQLSVKGNKIVDQSGTPVVLNGMSLFWSQWFPQFWNEKALSWLVKDWKIQIVRAAMAVNSGGYVENPAKEKAKMVAVIKAAIKLGIYVIVDWHAGPEDPQVSHAKIFFGEISKEFGMFPNVLFEPFNEPASNSWPTTKKYHETIVRVIRRHSKNICILGTAAWSQDVDTAADDPVKGENIAYTLHFYAATHKQSFRDKADYALKKGIAIFITEWGTCEASGDGSVDTAEATTWLNWAKQNKIGSTNWGVYDKQESCASLPPGASGDGGWPASGLTQSGKYLRNFLRNAAGEGPAPKPSKPADGPTPKPSKPSKPDSGKGKQCCSWDGKKSCGATGEWCNANKIQCEGSCQGGWIEFTTLLIVLAASAGLYFHQTQEFLTKFPEINKLLTSDLWKDKYVFKDVKLVINNHENTSAGILDDRGMLNVTGWTYANKMNAKKRKVAPVIFGWPKLSYLRFKHIDFYNFDIGEYSLRITGHVSGLHKWVLGMYRLEFFNWKTKDFVQTEAYITPYDTYAFRDGTVNFRKIHFRRNGLEVDVYRNHDTEWVIGIQVKLDNPKILVDTKIAEFPGISHVDTMDGKNGAYWLRRYGNMNGPIRRGVYKMKNNIRRVTEENIKTDFRVLPNMYHWQIKGMYEYKPFAYLRAIFQTKNLDDDPNEKNPRKRADMIHFSYAIEADTRADSEDLIQFIGIGKRVYKLEPVLHDIPSPNERLTGPVKFVTKDAGLYSERVVELTFTPHFSPPEKVTGNWAMYDKNFLVYGNWDGYMLDNKGKRFTVENAKGTISYGTTKF